MRARARVRSALAAATAITLLALVAVAMASLATTFALDAKRTSAGAHCAQCRQLLLAGAASVVDRLNAQRLTTSAQWDVPLPPSLMERQASLKVSVAFSPDGASATATVNATASSHTAVQTLTFTRDAERWSVADARIE